MVASVTEGEDKPLKYPLMFRTCDLVLVNKIDLLEHLDYDLDLFLHHLDAVHPGVPRMLDERADGRGRGGVARLAARAGLRAGGRARRDSASLLDRRPWRLPAGALAMSAPAGTDLVGARLEERLRAGERFFAAESERIARLCHRMAERFARGGRLVALGGDGADRSDVRHVTVEFVHPVIVGKRALPALGLSVEGGPLAAQAALVGRGRRHRDRVRRRRPTSPRRSPSARARGALTIAFADVGAEWSFAPPGADPFVRQELVETLYHVLWELVHVFLDQRGLLEGRRGGAVHDAGASSFLYPFLAEREDDLESVVADVRASVEMKSAEVGALRAQTLGEGRETLLARGGRPARRVRARRARCSRSATAARRPTRWTSSPTSGRRRPRPAGRRGRRSTSPRTRRSSRRWRTTSASRRSSRGRSSRTARDGDVVLAFSTSGGSANVILALEEARRRGLRTIALRRLRRRADPRRGARRPGRRQPLRAHPAHPGGAGERVPRAARAGRGAP